MLEPNCPQERGRCVKTNGGDHDSGVVQLNSRNANTLERQQECFKLCRSTSGATGCEVVWNQRNKGCYVHTEPISRGNQGDRHFCWVFSKCDEGKHTYLLYPNFHFLCYISLCLEILVVY